MEGDSAGGTTKQARDRRFQAVLPLRGKILNVEKADDQSLYNNNEISNLIIGLGLGLKGEGLEGGLTKTFACSDRPRNNKQRCPGGRGRAWGGYTSEDPP